MKHFKEFSDWLDGHLADISLDHIEAFCFNCYEGGNTPTWNMELVGSKVFDENDPDWACPHNEVFNARGRDDDFLFFIHRTEDIFEWEKGLEFMTSLVTEYLRCGTFAEKLKSVQAVAIGFVSGDLEIVYQC